MTSSPVQKDVSRIEFDVHNKELREESSLSKQQIHEEIEQLIRAMEINPGQFENLAKMTRMAIPSSSMSPAVKDVHTAVKLRNVHPPSGIHTGSQKRSFYTDSDTEQTATPRPSSYRSYDKTQQTKDNSRLLFYRDPFPGGIPVGEEFSVENRANLERMRNRQMHREKLRLAQEQSSYTDKRKRIYTRKQRDQRRAQQMAGHVLSPEVMSDIDNRYPPSDVGSENRWRRSRSGYSTPGGSCDEMKLGRNMRAAPRHIIDTMDALRSANQLRDKDKIERLNRQQQLLQQQRDQRKKFLEEQRLREKAQLMVNEALLTEELSKHKSNRSSRESLNGLGRRSVSNTSLVKRSVSNGSLAKCSVSNGSLANADGEMEKEDKMSDKVDPEPEGPSQGRMSRQSNPASEKTNKSSDFFDNARIEGQGILNDSDNAEENDKLMSAIRSEYQRLSTS
ncbi:uncharacterized protein LOC133186519 [Saccostrea echinata]|uniref:uncharacterized protein LOC133186519 n=1 Tax=Saccostrea echinata TaxID=191078 RepID=UPI002A812DA8|nr:uncharacterized protein LOC133186519 [Saccostrea echinata]